MKKTCPECFEKVRELERACSGCGYRVALVPEEEANERFVQGIAWGALATPVFAFGARRYGWFIASLTPLTFPFALVWLFFRGRAESWRHGTWGSFDEYRRRHIMLDRIGVTIAVIFILATSIFVFKK